MMYLFGKEQFKIRVNYKTGIQEEFWVYSFKFYNGTYSWKNVSPKQNPIMIGADDIESIWQIGHKKPLMDF